MQWKLSTQHNPLFKLPIKKTYLHLCRVLLKGDTPQVTFTGIVQNLRNYQRNCQQQETKKEKKRRKTTGYAKHISLFPLLHLWLFFFHVIFCSNHYPILRLISLDLISSCKGNLLTKVRFVNCTPCKVHWRYCKVPKALKKHFSKSTDQR